MRIPDLPEDLRPFAGPILSTFPQSVEFLWLRGYAPPFDDYVRVVDMLPAIMGATVQPVRMSMANRRD